MIDTNVLVAALRSSSGASHEILLIADKGDFEVALSVPLLAEYDDVCHRPECGICIPISAVVVKNINDMRIPPSNQLEKLSGNLEGYGSARLKQ